MWFWIQSKEWPIPNISLKTSGYYLGFIRHILFRHFIQSDVQRTEIQVIKEHDVRYLPWGRLQVDCRHCIWTQKRRFKSTSFMLPGFVFCLMLLSALSLCGSFALLWRQQHIRVSEGKRHWTIQLIAMSAVVHASLAEVQMPRLFNLSISGLSKEEMGFITAKLLCFPVLVTDWNSKPFHIYKI